MPDQQYSSSGRVLAGQDTGPQIRDLTKALREDPGKKLGDAPVIPLLLVFTGAYLLWFGIHYWRDKTVIWPSDPVKSVLQGNGLPPKSPATSEQTAILTAETTAVQQASTATSSGSSGSGSTGSGYQGGVPAGTAQNTAKLLLPKYGWDAAQMPYLILLWTRESSWNANARNPTSGAYGIAQALGHGGAGTAAPDGTNEYGAEYGLTDAEAQQANAGDARWQIEWGLGYIKSRYGSPQAAWAHEQSAGWY